MNVKSFTLTLIFLLSVLCADRIILAEETPTHSYSIKLYTQSGIEAAKKAGASGIGSIFFIKINDYKAQLSSMRLEVRDLPKEQQISLIIQIREMETKLRKNFGELLRFILHKQASGNVNPLIVSNAKSLLLEESEIIRTEIEYVKNTIKSLRQGANDLETAELFAWHQAISRKYNIYDGLLSDLLENSSRMENLGIPVQEDLTFLDKILHWRALTVSGEIKLIQQQLADLNEQRRNATKEDRIGILAKITAVEEHKDGLLDSLSDVIVLLNTRGIETTEYSKLLIKAKGQLSSEIFDSDVAFSLLHNWLDFSMKWLKGNGIEIVLKIFSVIVTLFVFRLFASLVKRLVKRTIGRKESDYSNLMGGFFVSMSGKIVMILGFLLVLSQLGIKVAPLLAGLGIIGFIIGFALQDVLSNFASGMMILIYQPFDIGDTIEVPDVSGYVQNMNLVSTIILTYDNQKLVVPNNKIWGNIIRNIHSEPTRRVDMSFGVSYETDLDKAETVLKNILDEHDLVLSNPPPRIKLHTLNDSSVDFIVRPWTKTENYWEVYWDITRSVKKRFDEEGIPIPYPQRDVHIKPRAQEAIDTS